MLVIWERGVRREATMLPNGRVARLSYDVLEFFWFFGYAVNLRWEVVGRDAADDVLTTRDAIETEYDITLSEPGIWKRYGLFITIIAIGIVAIVRFTIVG